MENYLYKCEFCGLVHLVPAYWTSFNAEEAFELIHINIKTGEQCTNSKLLLLEDQQ